MEIIANLLWQMRAHFHKSLKKRKKLFAYEILISKREEIDSMIDVYYSVSNSSRVLPTSQVVYQPINHRNL